MPAKKLDRQHRAGDAGRHPALFQRKNLHGLRPRGSRGDRAIIHAKQPHEDAGTKLELYLVELKKQAERPALKKNLHCQAAHRRREPIGVDRAEGIRDLLKITGFENKNNDKNKGEDDKRDA